MIDTPLIFKGANREHVLIEKNDQETNFVTINGVALFEMQSISVKGGDGKIDIVCEDSNLIVKDCFFTEYNKDDKSDLFIIQDSQAIFENCFFTDCHGFSLIDVQNSNLTIKNCVLTESQVRPVQAEGSTIRIFNFTADQNQYVQLAFEFCDIIIVESLFNDGTSFRIFDSTGSIRNTIISSSYYIYSNNSEMEFTNITYERNSPMVIEGSALIKDCKINNNHSSFTYFTYGGGLKLDNCTAQVKNSRITDNWSNGTEGYGGGIFGDGGNVIIDSCVINYNRAGFGGGIYCKNADEWTIKDCIVDNNTSYRSGGGIYIFGETTPLIVNTVIKFNTADYGGGIHCFDNAKPIFKNCFFNANYALYGGAVHTMDSAPEFINCTFVNNDALNAEGGISIVSGEATLKNCILWYNKKGTIGGNIPATIFYSNIEGGYEGVGNIDTDPLFIERDLWGDYHLSPCVDAGNPESDLIVGTTRTDGILDSGVVDMGYHYPPNIQFGLSTNPEKEKYTQGDEFFLLEDIRTSPAVFSADIYFSMENPDGVIFYGMNWGTEPTPALGPIMIPENLDIEDLPIMKIVVPEGIAFGEYTFSIYATKPGTLDFISNIATVSFTVE